MTLEHLVQRPRAGAGRPPLALLLHGVGADEADLFSLGAHLDPRFLVVSARAPLLAQGMGYAWYPIDWSTRPPAIGHAEVEASRERLARFVPELCDRYGADPARVFLLGFSQGAVMSLELALVRPGLVRGVMAHSGRLLPETLSRAAEGGPGALEVLLQHGTLDEVIPVSQAHVARERLAALLGDRLEYREYAIGHGISEESLADLAAWSSARLGR